MTQNHWKQLLKTDFVFRELLSQLVQNRAIKKADYNNELQMSAKYELIKMESESLLELKNGEIHLGEKSDMLIDMIYNPRLKSAV